MKFMWMLALMVFASVYAQTTSSNDEAAQILSVSETQKALLEQKIKRANEKNFPEQQKQYVNIDINETFYRIVPDELGKLTKRQRLTTSAKIGDIIELEIVAYNPNRIGLNDIELINAVPDAAIELFKSTIKTDLKHSHFYLSSNGDDFFPVESEFDAANIRYVKWSILTLGPKKSIALSYRFKVLGEGPHSTY